MFMLLNKEDRDEFRRHMDKCDERDERNREIDADIVSELKALSKSQQIHTEREESDRLNQREESKAITNVLNAIADRLTNMEKEISQQPSIIREGLLVTKGDIMTDIREEFATKQDLNGAITALRTQLKWVWYAFMFTATGGAWVYANVIT